jgi:hypothetical protein
VVATHNHSARPATIDRSAIECQKSAATEALHPGDIISERRATSSRNAWATSSESAHLAWQDDSAIPVRQSPGGVLGVGTGLRDRRACHESAKSDNDKKLFERMFHNGSPEL